MSIFSYIYLLCVRAQMFVLCVHRQRRYLSAVNETRASSRSSSLAGGLDLEERKAVLAAQEKLQEKDRNE